jgi:L-seryl-tRNA(Ser) seleniumtransferase
MLANLRGLRLEREPDPPGNPFERLMLHVDQRTAGITAFQLGQALGAGDPKIVLRSLHADRGYLLLDTRRIDDAELETVVARIRAIFAGATPGAAPVPTPQGGDLTRQAMARWLGG